MVPCSTQTEAPFGRRQLKVEANEAGYALVALLAVMTLLALFALAALPSVRQQNQREREKEAIFRGEQMADAIRAYYVYRVNAFRASGDQGLPTSMDQLLEGLPIPGGSKKRQIIRRSAVHDPLSASGEWRYVRPRSQQLIDFQRAIILYAGNTLPPTSGREMTELQRVAVPQITSILNIDSEKTATGGEDLSADSTGPFIGVTSRSKNNSVLYYYGIDRHDQWVFTPLFR